MGNKFSVHTDIYSQASRIYFGQIFPQGFLMVRSPVIQICLNLTLFRVSNQIVRYGCR